MSERKKVQANKLFAKGKYIKALKEYLAIHQGDPDDVSVTISIGNTYLNLNEKNKAFPYFLKAAEHYSNQGFLSKALVIYKRIRRLDPSNLELMERMVALLIQKIKNAEEGAWQEKYKEEAIGELMRMATQTIASDKERTARYFAQMLKVDPLCFQAAMGLADLEYGKGMKASANERLLGMARLLLAEQKVVEARKTLDLATKHGCDHPLLLTMHALIRVQEGETEEGINDLKTICRQFPDHVNAMIHLGRTYLNLDRYTQAKRWFLTAFWKQKDKGEPDEAICKALKDVSLKLLRQGLTNDAYQALSPLADYRMEKGLWERAIRVMRFILAVDPGHPEAGFKIATFFQKAGDIQTAGGALANLFDVFKNRGESALASQALARLGEILPNSALYRERASGMPKAEAEGTSAQTQGVVRENTVLTGVTDIRLLESLDLEEAPPSQAVSSYEVAHTDEITKLPDRVLFLDRLEQCLKQAMRGDARIIVMVVQIKPEDPSRIISAEIQMEAAALITGALRASDTVSGFGEGTFGVLLMGVLDPVRVEKIAEKIQKCLEGFADGALNAAIGIAVFPEDTDHPQTLIKLAGDASNQAGGKRLRQILFANEELNETAARRHSLERELRRALDLNEFVLHYQPVFNIAADKPSLIGLEALVRWQNPEMGLLQPSEFIPFAEELGMMSELGEWILHAAVRQAVEWHGQGIPLPGIFLNVAMLSLDRRFQQMLEIALRDLELPEGAFNLYLEGNETQMLGHGGENLERLRHFRAMGVSLVVDDFGSGDASLTLLARSPVEIIKIDRFLVEALPAIEENCRMTRAILALAHSLGIKVIAEGVETEEQMAFLKEAGCDFGQGFLLSNPLPLEALEDLLASLKS